MFSYLRTLTTWHCPNFSLHAAAAVSDQYFLTAGPCLDRQTDGEADTVPFSRPYSVYYACSANNERWTVSHIMRGIAGTVHRSLFPHFCWLLVVGSQITQWKKCKKNLKLLLTSPKYCLSCCVLTTVAIRSGPVASAFDCGVRGPKLESHRRRLCLSRQPLR